MSVSPSVCDSGTHVDCVETAKHVVELFSLSRSPTILDFRQETVSLYSHGDPPNGGDECNGV